MPRPGSPGVRAFERTKTTMEWPFARASRTIRRPLPPDAPKQEPLCLISILIGGSDAVHAVTAFWAAAKTSRGRRARYVLRTLDSEVSHPAFTASNISSAGPV